MLGKVMGSVHKFLGRSTLVTNLALKLRNQANAVVAAHFSSLEAPEQNGEYALIDLVAPSADNFIDVGGNIGAWSSRFISRMEKQPAGLIVDANTECVVKLRARFEHISGLSVLNVALSDYSGEAVFFEGNGENSVLSSLTPIDIGGSEAVAKTVRVMTLDEAVEAMGWEKVSMLKIDAEGHDFFVLRGARKLLAKNLIDFIQFECNSTWAPVGLNIVAATNFLHEFGYQVFQLAPTGLRSIDVNFYGSCGSSNWVALHRRSPSRGIHIQGPLRFRMDTPTC